MQLCMILIWDIYANHVCPIYAPLHGPYTYRCMNLICVIHDHMYYPYMAEINMQQIPLTDNNTCYIGFITETNWNF